MTHDKNLTLFASEQLVSLHEGKIMTSSLQVAQHFGKEHKNVLRDIRNIECSSSFQQLNFEHSFYVRELPSGGQKKEPMYYMTKDGFVFLVMGFTGKVASVFKEDYIRAFNQMEAHIQQTESTELISLRKENRELSLLLIEKRTTLEFLEKYINSSSDGYENQKKQTNILLGELEAERRERQKAEKKLKQIQQTIFA